MSKRRWVASKLFAVLGGAGLAIGVCVPRASAQPPPFSNANYANRYVCNVTSDGDFFTGLMTLYPNGAGTYTKGTLEAPISSDGGTFSSTLPPTQNFCLFNLDVAGSSYAIDTHGNGVEVLSWTADTLSNNPSCTVPFPTSTFVMSNDIMLRAYAVKPSGAVIRAEITSNNLLNFAFPGHGYCVK